MGTGGRQAGSLITSQIDTAPKLRQTLWHYMGRLITSQIDTAPKQGQLLFLLPGVFDYQSDRHCAKTLQPGRGRYPRLITSQIDTAPKQEKA